MSQQQHCVALMYHALYENQEEWNALLDEEKPYAISTAEFEKHLQLLEEWDCPILAPSVFKTNPIAHWQPGVVLTFDDGHKSHYTHALPILQKYGYKALFFVTTAFTDNDPHFCSWNELKEMAAAGMDIHAHGHTHSFFANMNEEEAHEELRHSYHLLKTNIAAPWSMSFPGGRYTKRDVELAKRQGYSHVFTSEVGVIHSRRFLGQKTLPRFAIRSTTTETDLKSMVMPSSMTLTKAKAIALAKTLVKKMLGNSLYHKLYTMKAGRQN